MAITRDELIETLSYDPSNGVFRWRKPSVKASRVRAGDVAGATRPDGYVQICIGSKRYFAHRLAWLYIHGEWPPEQIDHIDRDKGNNRIDNLRLATARDNQRNRGTPANNSTGVKGVSATTLKDGRVKYTATVKPATGYQTFLGSFDTIEEAKSARERAAVRMYGQFASEAD